MLKKRSSMKRLQREVEMRNRFIAKLTAELAALRGEQAEVLFAFAQDIEGLREAIGGFDELAEAQRKAYQEQLKKDIGFQNMMNF